MWQISKKKIEMGQVLFHSTLSGNTAVLPFYGELVATLRKKRKHVIPRSFPNTRVKWPLLHSANGATSALKVPPHLCTFALHRVNVGSQHHNQHDMWIQIPVLRRNTKTLNKIATAQQLLQHVLESIQNSPCGKNAEVELSKNSTMWHGYILSTSSNGPLHCITECPGYILDHTSLLQSMPQSSASLS